MSRQFFTKIEHRFKNNRTLLCVGLDPHLDYTAIASRQTAAAEIVEKNRKIIEETTPFTACYKPNIAFYEALGPDGLAALKQTIEAVPEDIPVIIDGKRNDIGSTAAAYAYALFSFYNADCVTLNPYLGYESIAPFIEYPGKGMFLLCRTSNPGSDALQACTVVTESAAADRGIDQGPERDGGARDDVGKGVSMDKTVPFYVQVAREVCAWSERIGLVIGATVPEAIRTIRREFPDVWMLCPGIGAQGGSLEESLRHGLREDGMGILPMVGRAIYQDKYPGQRAEWFCEQIARVSDSIGR